jgi:SAM-dependent methyltransferase
MLKQYLPKSQAGSSSEFWEDNWKSYDRSSLASLERWDPLVPHYLRGTAPNERVLEGGCGLGQYVVLLREHQRAAIGLDFALSTLGRIRAAFGDARLAGGNVAALPFRDASFATYISQGVVEHFESGPEAGLAEAYRVLQPGGLLLISVPDLSPLRRTLMLGRGRLRRGDGSEWVRVDRHSIDEPARGLMFFQYVYTPGEFRRLLEAHGFSVEWHRGYSVIWGLQDLAWFRVAAERLLRRRRVVGTGPSADTLPAGTATGHDAPSDSVTRSGVRALVLREEGWNPLTRALVRMFTASCANMRLYGARKPVAARHS